MPRYIAILAAVTVMVTPVFANEGEYSRVHTQGEENFLFNLGPTGMWGYGPKAIRRRRDGKNPDFIIIKRVEKGSPADGLVRQHDIITGANGTPFPANEDALIPLAHAMIDSEAKDGRLHLQITRSGTPITVTLRLQRLPDYSPSWPLDCSRTDTMLVNACDFLAREQMPNGQVVADDGNIGPIHSGLLWLSMGEPRYLENARRAAYWFAGRVRADNLGEQATWPSAYGGMLLAEYYQMTGDKNVLPELETIAARIAQGQLPSGGWTHGLYSGFGAAYGELNNVGMICYMTLLLAKECGVNVDEMALHRAASYFDRWAPTLTIQYGDYYRHTMGYHSLNGKIGGLAVAHRLHNDPVVSAGYALKAARSMNSIEAGHTGHFFNILWNPVGASFAPAKEYRRGMDQIGWYYALSRTWRGGFFCQPSFQGQKYSKEGGVNMTTGGIGLGLAAARQHLRILGSPKSVFLQTLPPELDTARRLHEANRWDEAIAAVDTFLEQGGHDAETLRLANQLRDKARYVKESVVVAYAKLEALSQGTKLTSRAYEVAQMMKPLELFLGEDDARLMAIRDSLPEPFRVIWSEGEAYYDAFRKLSAIRLHKWLIYSHMVERAVPSLAMPFDTPEWQSLVQTEDERQSKWLHFSAKANPPKNWNGLPFDDANWTAVSSEDTKRTSNAKSGKGHRLIRIPFEMKDVEAKRLRIAVKDRVGLSAGAKVYLNGEEVLTTFNGIKNSHVELLEQTVDLLQEGTNVLAYLTEDEGVFPMVSLQAVMNPDISSFAWTVQPARPAGIRELVARRRKLENYYQPDKDMRTVEELMAVYTADPLFAPEVYHSIPRFQELLPEFPKRAAHIETLLKAATWGGRWTGLYLLEKELESTDPKQIKRLPAEERAQATENAEDITRWAEKRIHEIVALLNDPHPQVRYQAASVLKRYGASAEAAKPDLIALLSDIQGENWFIRDGAWTALASMPLSDSERQVVLRLGLNDPNTFIRNYALKKTFYARDNDIQKEAIKVFMDEMIDQVFDAPHAMMTKKTRSEIAKTILSELTKDQIRPYLPRFLTSLNRPEGHQLTGSMAILASFGEEIWPQLETLTKDEDPLIRYNALETLYMIAMQDDASAKRIPFLLRELKPIRDSENVKRASWAEGLMEELEKKQTQDHPVLK